MKLRIQFLTLCLLSLLLTGMTTQVGATHISKPVLVEPGTQYRVGEQVVVDGWVDYNAQPTADVLLQFEVATQDGALLAEQFLSSDKQGHFHFEFDTHKQPPDTYTITVTSHCLEVHRSICSFNKVTSTFVLDNP